MTSITIPDHFSTDLQGKIGIVTGGASGIGLAAAKILSSLGAKVHIFDIVPWEQADADSNPEINFHACDVTSWIELRNAFKSVGHVDLVFANAGISERVNFFAETLDDGGDLQEPPLEQMDVNFKAMIYSIKLAWFGMKKQKSGGSIVLTSSATAYVPWQSLAVYSSAKLALIGMVRSLRSLLPCDNITINAVAPGATVTNLLPTHLHNAVKAIGAPISSAHTVAKALVFSATAMEARRVEDYGKDKGEEREEVRRWNGRVILVLGDQYTEVEEEYAGLRSRCLGEENHR